MAPPSSWWKNRGTSLIYCPGCRRGKPTKISKQWLINIEPPLGRQWDVPETSLLLLESLICGHYWSSILQIKSGSKNLRHYVDLRAWMTDIFQKDLSTLKRNVTCLYCGSFFPLHWISPNKVLWKFCFFHSLGLIFLPNKKSFLYLHFLLCVYQQQKNHKFIRFKLSYEYLIIIKIDEAFIYILYS